MVIGIWLMFTRVTLETTANMANADHVIGALIITVVVTAMAETGRAVRFLLLPLGASLLATPFVFEATTVSTVSSIICGLLVMGLSVRRGSVASQYGKWNKLII